MGASILQFAGALIITTKSKWSAVQFNKIAVEPTAVASRFAKGDRWVWHRLSFAFDRIERVIAVFNRTMKIAPPL